MDSVSQVFYRFSCVMFIDTLKLPLNGRYYLIWEADEQASTQTMKYTCKNNEPVKLEQTLTLNITLFQKGSYWEEKSTYLTLVNQDNQAIDSVELMVNEWTQSYKDTKQPIGSGLMQIKVRKKMLRVLNEGEIQFPSQVAQESLDKNNKSRVYDQSFFRNAGSGGYKGNHNKSFLDINLAGSDEESITYEQRIKKLQNSLQDALYLNNKIKNDRDTLLSKQQQLKNQLEMNRIKFEENLSVLREHFEQKTEMQSRIYEDEIRKFIDLVNHNSDCSKRALEQTIRQKIKIEEELSQMIKLYHQKTSQLQDFKTKFHGELEMLNKLAEEKIKTYEKQKEEQIKKKQQEAEEKRKELQRMEKSLLKQKEDIEKELEVYKAQFQKSRINSQSMEEQLYQKNKKMEETSQILQQKHAQIQKANKNMQTLSDLLSGQEKTLNEHKKRIQILKQVNEQKLKQIEQLNQQILKKDEALQELNGKYEQLTYQLQFNEDSLNQLKAQHNEKQQELYTQLENIQNIYNQKLQQCTQSLRVQIQTLNQENQLLKRQLQSSEKRLSEFQSELEGKQSELASMKEETQEMKEKKIQKMEKEREELKQTYENKLTRLQEEYCRKDSELSQKLQRLEKQLQTVRKEAAESQIKIQHYEQQLQNIYQQETLNQQNPNINQKQRASNYMNRSIQMSRIQTSKESIENSKHSFSLGPINIQEMQNELQVRTMEFENLAKKHDQLERLYRQLADWVSLVKGKYPHLDWDELEADPGPLRIVECCDSEKEEERQINQNQSRRQNHMESLQKIQSRQQIIDLERSDDKYGQQSPKYSQTRKSFPSKNNVSYLKRRQSLGLSKQFSQHSNTSYIKVSHTKKIQQLEELISQLEQKGQNDNKQMQKQINLIEQLNEQIRNMKEQLSQYWKKPPINQSTLNQLETLRSQNQHLKNTLAGREQLILTLEEKMQTHQQKLTDLLQEKNTLKEEIQTITQKARELKEATLNLETKLKQAERRLQISQDSNKKLVGEIQQHLKSITTLQCKIRQLKQHQQQLRMQNRQMAFLNEQTTNQMKKFKQLSEQYEQKLRKYAGSDITLKQLQKEIQDWNRKNLQQVRTHNHLKLEKDSLEEEMKLLKKRHAEQTRLAIEWEEKALSLERNLDEFKRKEVKYKRQVQEAQEETRKMRSNLKKTQEELHSLQTLQSSFNYEKKKFMDQVAQKQDEVTRKQYQNARLLKQLQKYRHRIEETQDARMGRKHQLRYQIEKLEGQLIKKEKRTIQDQEEIKMLKGRLEFLEKENKKIMEQKTQTYGDKLKHYVDEIASIKKLLDEYQAQNTRLKVHNNQFYEQNQLLKLSMAKLQKKYEQNIDNEENILTDLQHYIDELAIANDKVRNYEVELDRLEQAYLQVKKQHEEEKMSHRKKADKLEGVEHKNGLLMDEIKEMKIRISQLETESKINYNINQKYRNLDRKKSQIEQQLKKLKQDHHDYMNLYIYREEDIQQAVSSVRTIQSKKRQEEIAGAVDEVTQNSNMKISKLEGQLLELFNENSRLREQLVEKGQQLSGLKLQIEQMQTLQSQCRKLEGQQKENKQQLRQLRQQVQLNKQKQTNDQYYIQQLQNKVQIKQNQLKQHLIRLNELQMSNENLMNKLSITKQNQQKAQEQIRQFLRKEKQKVEQNLKQNNQGQHYQKKIFQMEVQLVKATEKEHRLTDDYNAKIRRLEEKLEEMATTMKEHQEMLEKHYEEELAKSQQSILQLSQQLEDKLQRIDELNEALITLQQQNQQLAKQLSSMRYKFDQQTQIFNIEYGKLKNKLKESQDVYNTNLKNLQQELTSMGKELALAKYKREENTSSRLRTSQYDESKKTLKRLEDKVKAKDNKIEELKSNIYILEETILKLRKKQSNSENIASQLDNAKNDYLRLEEQSLQVRSRLESEIQVLEETVRGLRKDILEARQKQEKAVIELEENRLEVGSMKSELQTTKSLYNELQKQIDRRKVHLAKQMQQQSNLGAQLRNREGKVVSLERRLEQLDKQRSQLKLSNNKLKQQNQILFQKITQLHKSSQLLNQNQNQTQNQKTYLKSEINQLKEQCNRLVIENKGLKEQLVRLKKHNEEIKTQLSITQTELEKYQTELAGLRHSLHQKEKALLMYLQLEDVSTQKIGVTLDQLLDEGGLWEQNNQQKQTQIDQLLEEVEQLKFLADRKLLDYEELKRENYELTLKAQDNQILADQVDNLRRICDKLEQEKKSAVFRQQLLKMQISNLAQNQQNEQNRNKIESILRNCNMQFGGIALGESSFGNF